MFFIIGFLDGEILIFVLITISTKHPIFVIIAIHKNRNVIWFVDSGPADQSCYSYRSNA